MNMGRLLLDILNYNKYRFMKKLFFSLIMGILMIACSSQFDEPKMTTPSEYGGQSVYLTPTEACEIASTAFENFNNDGCAKPYSRSARNAYAHLYESSVFSRSQTPSLYVVDFEEGGFVVVNAHREASTQIYAVVEDGQFDDSDNPGLKYYMEYAEERAASDHKKRLGNIEILPPIEIKKDKLINRRDTLITPVTKWHRNAPYNTKCALMPNSSERYPVGTIAMSLATLIADQKSRRKDLREESFRDGRVYYSFNWAEMLEFTTIDHLSKTGRDDVCELLEYFNTFDYRQDIKGDFINHDVVPDGLATIMEYSHWLSKPYIFKNGTSVKVVMDTLCIRNTPQVIYGEEEDKSVGDVWLIQGARIDTYQKVSPSIDGSEPGPIYEQEYLYFNWCLGGRSNGWYFYNVVWHDYYNNDDDTGNSDPDIVGESYTKNILMALGSLVSN